MRGRAATPELTVALDARELADAGRGTGVARYVQGLLGSLDGAGVRVRTLRRNRPRLLAPHVFMPLAMRMGGAQVMHGPANALPIMQWGLPGVLTIHDLAIYEHPEWFPDRQWLSTRMLVPRSARRARVIICPSEATVRAAVARFRIDARRFRVIPHGVEPQFSRPAAPAARDELRRRLGLPDRFVLQVGTIQPRKNYEATLRALAAMPEAERVPLIVIGDFGWKFEPVLRLMRELQLSRWVRFIGYLGLRDLPALYQLASAVAFPSLDEGFGFPVLEGFAAGVPVVAGNAGAIPEVAGDAALLVPPADHHALAEALMLVLTRADMRDRLVAAGRARAERYTWAGSAAAHRAVYAEVAGVSARGGPL